MTPALVASVAVASAAMSAAMPQIDKAEVRAAIQSLKVMTEAVPVVPPPGDPNAEAYFNQHLRLTELMLYTGRFTERVLREQVVESELFNLLQVCRDLVDAGVKLSPSPREAIPWHRAIIRFTKPLARIVARNVQAKRWSPGAAKQLTAALELFEKELQAAREKLRVHSSPFAPRKGGNTASFRGAKGDTADISHFRV